jgi:DNA-binding NarL/FixJ family response regulator
VSIKVAIVEDDQELRWAFARLVEKADGFECVAQYSNGADALAGLPADRPDVVLMDINMPCMNGIECVQRLKVIAPDIQIVMLTVFEDSDSIFESLKAGASGYVTKRAPAAEILNAIRDVQSGGAPMSGVIARKVVQFFNQPAGSPAELEGLTDREREVLKALAEGQFYKEIADNLSISINTVRKHIKGVYEKLHVHTRHEAVAKITRK